MNQRGGAERVFAHIARAYPAAPVYTSLHDPAQTADLIAPERVRTSFLQRIPLAQRYFRYLAPLYPRAFESFDLRGNDLIISSTTAWAKGVRVPPGSTHVCYINTVSRFTFAYDAYVGGLGAAALARPLVRRLVEWDTLAAQRPSAYIANSHNVAARVLRYYGRQAYVLHCPVDVDRFAVGGSTDDYFLVVSRLLPYKRIDCAIEACRLAGARLIVVGSGPAEAELKERARGTRTEFAGALDDRELRGVMQSARALLVPAEEDFGLIALEANASGRPAIAYAAGGALETVRPGVTGELVGDPSPAALAQRLREFRDSYDPALLRAHAEAFAPARFVERLREIVAEVVAARA